MYAQPLPDTAQHGMCVRMGTVYVEAEVAHEGGVALSVRFLVDSGAVYSVLPTEVWTALGLVPTREMEFVLAD